MVILDSLDTEGSYTHLKNEGFYMLVPCTPLCERYKK